MWFRAVVRRTLEFLLTAVFVLGCDATLALAQTQDDVFDDSVIQDVRLTVSTRDWATLTAHFEENTYYPADLTWKNIVVRNVGIRSRGSGTRNGIKPGLKVDINRYLSNQLFLGLKAFDLKNMYTDPSHVRETVAMKIYRRMGINTPREAQARLFVNGEYIGLYVLVEAIDRTFVERMFGSRESEVENGGYLFEYQWVFQWGVEYLGSDLKAYAPSFEPQTRDTDAVVRIYGPIEAMVRTINEAADQDFEALVGEYLDLQRLMTQLAVEQFTVEWDGLAGNWGINNFYLYRFRETTRGQVIPWDRDHAFTWDGQHALDFINAPIALRLDTSVLARRALAIPHLRQVFFDALSQCAALAAEPASDDPRGWLEREIDQEMRQIVSAVADDHNFPFSLDQFQTEGDFLKLFARVRPPTVQCQLALSGSSEAASCRAGDPPASLP
jgi:hypothetical protein